jgi:hypothetical protein
MGTTQKTSTQNTYDPGSMQAFQGLTPQFASTVGGYMSNPFGNPFFQTQQQMGNRQAQNMGQTAMSGLQNNMIGSGMAGGASNPAATEMMQNQARANTGLQSQLGFLAPVMNALQMQQGAMNAAGSYRPLQTGGNQTQSTGGLGTWLPQLAGAGLGLAGMAMGMPGMGGGLFGSHSPQMQGFSGGDIGGSLPTGGGGMLGNLGGGASPFSQLPPPAAPSGGWFGGND